jgi:hypothetical protein
MLSQQPTVSVAQIKVNFMDPTKKAEKIAQCQSKVYNRVYRDKSIGVISELSDGLNLNVEFLDEGVEDMTKDLIGLDVNVRFTREQFNALNARFHTMEAIGAYIEVELDGNVEWGTLTVRGEDVESYTLYVKEVKAVEAMEIARVGSKTTKEDFIERLRAQKERKAAKSESARAQSRAARQSTDKATEDKPAEKAEQLTMNFG